MDIQQFRELNPNFKSIGDKELSQKLYNTYYADKMDFDSFDRKFRPLAYKYGALDKAKYMGRAAGEGLTFGLGDIVGGITNTVMAPIGKTVNHFVEGAPLTASDFNPVKNFTEGRGDFVREQDEFKEAHPWLNAVGELVGGLTTGVAGAGKAIAGNAAKTGIRGVLNGVGVGAAYGGAYGAGSGFTENPDEFSIKGAVEGAIPSALLGGAFGGAVPVAIGGVGKVGKVIRNIKNKDFRAVEKLAGADLAKAAEEGVPLIDSANEGVMDLALATKQADPKAAQIYADYARARQGQSIKNISNAIDDNFGNKGFSQAIAEMDEKAAQAYQPAYEKAMFDKNGLPKRVDFNATIDEADYIGKVRRTTGLKTEVRGLADNDMRVLDYAKQLMDDDINKAVNQGDNAKVRALTKLKNQFLEKIDAKNPEYATARKIFADNQAKQAIMEQGQKIGQGSQSEKAYELSQLAQEDLPFYRQGVREALLKKFNTQKTAGGNVSQKIFDYDTMQRLKNVGLSDYEALNAIARRENIASANMQRLLQGSQTAEKEASVGRWFTNPTKQTKGLVARTIDNIYGKVTRPNPLEVARMLTDKNYLAQKQLQAMQGDIGLARRIGKYNFDLLRSGGIIGGDIVANGKSWQHLRKSPDWRTFAGIPKIRNIVEEGKAINNIPNYKARGDNFNGWNYYVKEVETPQGMKTQLVTVGQKPAWNELHGFNPDLIEWAQKNPDKAKDIADFISMRISASDKDGYTNSIADILRNVKAKKWTKEDRKAIQEILRQAGYKGPVILEQQEAK